MTKWIKSKFTGVRYREHPDRKHGAVPDRYYTIFYKLDGKMHQEGLGWASESWEEQGLNGQKKRVNWTEKRAAAALAELKKNRSLGAGPRTLREKRADQKKAQELLIAESLTVSQFWEQDYLLALKARIQPSSWKKEVTHYELHIKPLLGNRALKSITPEDLEKILDQLKIKELSPRSKQYAIGTFFRIWKHAAKRKFVKTGDNPASGISIERVNNARLRILSSKELQDILDHLKINDPHGFELVIFCAYTGCRFSEAARLTWEYVDLNRKAILFHQTKNKDSREIYLAAGIVEVLNARGLGLTGQHVFTKKDGSSFKEPPSSFSTAVRLLELNQGRGARDRVSFHTLRHTAATIAARNKIPVKDMQHMFGWKTPAMVFLYAKGNEDIQRSAAEGIAKSLSGDNTKIISLEESLLSKKHVV